MVLGFTAAGLAQTQWFVGPGGYGQIRDVMPLVAPGDTVLVAPGTYPTFDCSRGVTIRAVTPGTVTVAWNPLFTVPSPCGCTCLQFQGPVRFTIPFGETAHVVGLSFAGYCVVMLPCGLLIVQQSLVATGGRLTFDQCSIDHLVANGSTLHLQDCTVTSASGAGLQANGADVTIAGGTVSGSAAGAVLSTFAASPAISLSNSRLHACGVTVTGGAPSATLPGAPGIAMNGGSLWLSDATVTAGGGCAVQATGLVRIDRSTLTGSGSGCAVSPTGAPLVGIDRSGPIQIGALFQVTVASEPSALVIVYGSTKLAPPLLAPIVEQPVWIDPTLLFLADVAIADPTGQTTFSYPVPNVPVLVGAQFWLQGVGGTSFPLQTSPVVGGIVR